MIIDEGQQAIYHVISRTALDGLPFNAENKDMFVKILKSLSAIYFTEILGYSVMDNHFHLLVKMLPECNFSDDEIKRRFILKYGDKFVLDEKKLSFYRKKWSKLSDFIKELKQSFSVYFNKTRNRRGTLWGERFKSVLLEKGETLIHCLAYIDLNAVRAGMVKKPEEYRWCSIGYHIQTGNKESFLSLDFGLCEFGVKNDRERLKYYRKYLYEVGSEKQNNKASISSEAVNKERERGYELSRVDRFLYRTRYFTDSGIIGSKAFVYENYLKFRHLFQSKHEKKPKKIQGLPNTFSLKQLQE
jgi:REP element-mobilizing transposase RayT